MREEDGLTLKSNILIVIHGFISTDAIYKVV